MDLRFISPWAFNLLYALPLLVIPHMVRPHAHRILVAAVFLYEGLSARARPRLWGRPHLTPLFFLQLLVALLLILVAAQPVLRERRQTVALILDTSASMQARGSTGASSVFDLAKHRASIALGTLTTPAEVSLFTSAPRPRLVSTASGAPDRLRTDLALVRVTDAPDPSDASLVALFSRLLTEAHVEQVFFFTDRPLVHSPPPAGLQVVTIGEPRPNLGIAAFRVYRSPFQPDQVEATVMHGT